MGVYKRQVSVSSRASAGRRREYTFININIFCKDLPNPK